MLGLGLLGCGGLPNPLPVGFVNQTKHSDAELWVVWKAAQESLAQEVDLDPFAEVIFRGSGGHSSRGPTRS